MQMQAGDRRGATTSPSANVTLRVRQNRSRARARRHTQLPPPRASAPPGSEPPRGRERGAAGRGRAERSGPGGPPSSPAAEPPSRGSGFQHRGELPAPGRPAPGMASAPQGEKQLFEKFWSGTFRAVATPRPGSAIAASIAARKPPPSTETPSCLSCPTEERRLEKPNGNSAQEASSTNGCVKGKDSRQYAHHRSRSPSHDEEYTPPPPSRGKKKKKKSTRKKRRRSPSYSPLPVKKKKKKKKKSSKKRKRNRLSSKKRRHSSSSPKSKRKEERKHKKHSRSRPRKSHRHRHRHYHSRSESSDSLSSSCQSRHRGRSQEEGHKARRRRSQHCSKNTEKRSISAEGQASHSPSQTLQIYSFLSAKEVISQSGSSADLFTKTDSPLGILASRNGGAHESDSGNDTSSPPSTQTSSARPKDSQEKRSLAHNGFGHAFSPGKPKLANSDNSSDSGNSFTSCFSQSKGTTLENLSPDDQGQDQRGFLSPCLACSEVKKQSPLHSPDCSSPLRQCSRSASYTSTGRSSRGSSRSAHSRSLHHKATPRYSRSRSCSSGKRSYSRSPSYSSKSCKRSPGSRNSRLRRSPSYSRYSPGRDRAREPKYGSSEKESQRERDKWRRRSYSPMRKRRRDSPSHLEARRITSARKRPIPYYRPSPSSSSSLSSCSSWYSSVSRSPGRSRSYSSYKSSRSRSWSSSSDSSRSRSRSSGPRSSRSRSKSYGSEDSYDSLRR
ncbi:serine/arginine repetitive matrix protein 4 [Dermochelys coriacea]|uniref:serine/arginine repetitive matrix protein 4 n=1 Tax=Dermochelys coriacea TaxID=27794 RepID=UPI0018E8772A|nr:serine/arginine repetitive matrix protein 4 [Dermochelys coriacea]